MPKVQGRLQLPLFEELSYCLTQMMKVSTPPSGIGPAAQPSDAAQGPRQRGEKHQRQRRRKRDRGERRPACKARFDVQVLPVFIFGLNRIADHADNCNLNAFFSK